jgi:hypothetical protein
VPVFGSKWRQLELLNTAATLQFVSDFNWLGVARPREIEPLFSPTRGVVVGYCATFCIETPC